MPDNPTTQDETSWDTAKRLFDIVHKGAFNWNDAPWRSQRGFLLMANTGDYGHLSDLIKKGTTNNG
jgi:hypothetical protein